MKRVLAVFFILFFIFYSTPVFAAGEDNTTGTFDPSAMTCKASMLVEQSSGKIVYEKNIHERLYPASLTKMMTAILAVENLDMDEVITVGREVNLKEGDASGAGLTVGEKISVSDLIRALLIPSGNDAAYTVAVQVARKKAGNTSMGTQEAITYFVGMMNEKAKELGATETNYTNPHGYHDDNHYTTAYDQYLIACELMKNEFLKEVIKTQSYKVMPAGSDSDAANVKPVHSWINRDELINPKSKYYYEPAIGIKTGYTSAAGNCLVSAAEKDGLSYIAVVLDSPTDEERWNESKNLLEYGFSNFQVQTVLTKGQTICNIKVGKRFFRNTVDLPVISDRDFEDLFNKNDVPDIKQTITWDEKLLDTSHDDGAASKLLGPISKGQVVGKVAYSLNGKLLVESDLIASESVMSLNVIDHILLAGEFAYKHWVFILVPLAVLSILILWFKRTSVRKSNSRQKFLKYRRY